MTLYAPAVKTTPDITPGVGGGFPWRNDNPEEERNTGSTAEREELSGREARATVQ